MKSVKSIGDFRVGGKARCIGEQRHRPSMGFGWEKDKTFVIRRITATRTGRYVLWPDGGVYGIYHEHAKPCDIVPEELFTL